MGDVEKIYSGPGIFIWGVDDQGVEEDDAVIFDLTQGGIRFYTESSYFEPTTDQTGTAPVKTIKTGTIGRVEFQSASVDFEDVVNFNTDIIKVVDGADPEKVKYQFTGLAGQELPRKRAVIKPQGENDPNRFIYIESSSVKFDVDARFELDANQTLPINVMAYPDLNASPRGLLYTWGDITATI